MLDLINNPASLSYLLGVKYSDGCTPKNTYTFTLMNKDEDFINEFAINICAVLGSQPTIYFSKHHNLWIAKKNSKRLYQVLNLPFPSQVKIIEQYPTPFLRAFFNGEGSCSMSENKRGKVLSIVLTNTNESLLLYVGSLLKKFFSIESHIRLRIKKGTQSRINTKIAICRKDVFGLFITCQKDLLLFDKLIGFGIERKQEALRKIVLYITTVSTLWTAEEIATLKNLYPQSPMAQILSELPKRNKQTVYTKAYNLKIPRLIRDCSSQGTHKIYERMKHGLS